MQKTSPLKVVVWQSAFLGDLVLTSNLLLNLFENLPSAEIFLVARPFAVELFKNFHPNLRVVPLEKTLKGTWSVIKTVKDSDLAFGVQRGARTSLSLVLAKIKERVGFNSAELAFLYTKRVEHSWGIHEVERNQKLLKAVGLKAFTDKLFLPMDTNLLKEVKEKFELPKEFVAVAASANFEPKRWSSSHFAELIEKITSKGWPVVLIGAKGKDEKVAQKVVSKLRDPSKVINLVGRTSVRELVHIIKLSRLVISNDSAPVHIAEAVETPVITVYCATSSYYGFFPRRGLFFEPKNLSCHPCKPNPKFCKAGTEECRLAVAPEEVWEGVKQLLKD